MKRQKFWSCASRSNLYAQQKDVSWYRQWGPGGLDGMCSPFQALDPTSLTPQGVVEQPGLLKSGQPEAPLRIWESHRVFGPVRGAKQGSLAPHSPGHLSSHHSWTGWHSFLRPWEFGIVLVQRQGLRVILQDSTEGFLWVWTTSSFDPL